MEALAPGVGLRVGLTDGRSLAGVLERVSEAELLLSSDGTAQTLRKEEIASVHRLGPHWWRPVLIGAGVGALAGTATGGALCHTGEPGEQQPCLPRFSSFGALVGTAIGGIVHLVRQERTQWIYSASQEKMGSRLEPFRVPPPELERDVLDRLRRSGDRFVPSSDTH